MTAPRATLSIEGPAGYAARLDPDAGNIAQWIVSPSRAAVRAFGAQLERDTYFRLTLSRTVAGSLVLLQFTAVTERGEHPSVRVVFDSPSDQHARRVAHVVVSAVVHGELPMPHAVVGSEWECGVELAARALRDRAPTDG
jgi:hypothetical protein